jgi:hypothetical protein
MEHVVSSHGAFAFMLLGLCGGVAGFKAGLWAFGMLCLVSTIGLLILALWEQRSWFLRLQQRRHAMTTPLPSVLPAIPQQKVTSP